MNLHSTRQRLVVIGNGMAGVRAVEEILKLAPEKFAITIIGEEPYGNYNRILLSPVLAGESTIDDIMLNAPQWYADNGIELIAGVAATAIDRARREVALADDRRVPYDTLIIATGSKPFILPVAGNDLNGVIGFRDIADVEAMLAAAKRHRDAVVIGGGLLGLEAANGLMKNGMNVTVVHLMDTLMERQLDPKAGAMLKSSLEERGMRFFMRAQTERLLGGDDGRVRAVKLADGREIDADLVVMAAGIVPEKRLAEEAGLYCERGIVVNDYMMTYDPRIFAVGECVQHRGVCYGLVAPLYEQARVLANHIAGRGWMTYEGSVTSTKLKVTGIDLFSAGDFLGGGDSEELIMLDEKAGVYKKLVIENDRLTGAVLYGDTMDGAWYFQLIREGSDISEIRGRLLFGQAHLGDSGHG
ncbi:MAG TPA: NAD(P)/FAD-dependent oxidoreductase, partial [Thermopetrobacter sp.]|nr:NAD(P)/FAD-dependent oxidoreductase [Thermopetrobacter sp.]